MIPYRVMQARKKILQKKVKPKKQALQKGFKPVPNNVLRTMLLLVNAIPPSIPTPPGSEVGVILAEDTAEFEQYLIIKSVEEAINLLPSTLAIPLHILFDVVDPQLLEKHLGISGLRLREYEAEPDYYFIDRFSELVEIYDYVVLGRKVFGIISKLDNFNEKIENVWENISLDIRLFIAPDGTIQFLKHPLVYALEGVDHTRIKQCPVCEQFFWAGRITQQCCSPRCSNTFRVRRHRFRSDEEKGELKLKRIQRAKDHNKK